MSKLVAPFIAAAERLLFSGGGLDSLSVNAGTASGGCNVVPGDCDISDITLTNEDGSKTVNIIPQVKAIEIWESITQPVIFAEFFISDSIGLMEEFPITGGKDLVSVSFSTPDSPASESQYVFTVNKVKDEQPRPNHKGTSYTLQCVSTELLRNANFEVNRKFEDKASNIIKSIIDEDIRTEKQVVVDDTRGIVERLISAKRPFVAIDMIRRIAISPRYNSSLFTFFENRNGFFFTTVEALIDRGKEAIDKGESDKVFFFDTTRQQDLDNVSMRNVLQYELVSFGDQITRVGLGGISNEVIEYDVITGNVRKVEYDGKNDAFVKSSPDATPITSTQFSNQRKTSTARNVRTISSEREADADISEKLSAAQAFALQMIQNRIHIVVYGDHVITAGDMVRCVFPSNKDGCEEDFESKLTTGSYLVSKVRHIIANTDRPHHIMALELIKGDMEGNL